jgi:hypothetical protein
VPGFLAGLTKLRKGFAEGYPFRGRTKRRTRLLVTDGTAAYQRAVDYNLAGRGLIKKWLDGAAAQHRDPILRNSAEWCLTGKAKIFCTTKTHDSAARVRAAHQPRRFQAVFGHPLGSITEAQVPYLRKLRGEAAFDNTNVEIKAPEGGSQTGIDIMFEDPAVLGKSYFLDTIRHEVQHAADHTARDDEGLYKTEINARWLETTYAGFSTRRQVRRMGFTWNERQFAAFDNLWSNPDLYPYLRANWQQRDAAKRAAWRAMVVGYKAPTSANPVNSVRIEDLTAAIDRCSPADCDAHDSFLKGTGAENAKAKAVKDAMAALDALDRSTVASIASLKAQAAVHLKGALKTEFDAIR